MSVDRVWLWYLAAACTAVAIGGMGAPQGQPAPYIAVHVGLAIGVLAVKRWSAVRGRRAQIWARGALAAVALPVVFSSMGWVLPAVHPEPYEWLWIAADRRMWGGDPTVVAGAALSPWTTEVLQWAYSTFYFLPVAVVVGVARRRSDAAFESALVTVVFCFLLSYLGYFLWPTLPPYRFLPHGDPLQGGWLANTLYASIDAVELHRWNCFPSGHTMVSVVCLALAWRWVRGLFLILLPVVSLLVVSTVALRYHYAADVLAGLILVPPTLWMARILGPGDS